MKKYPKLNNQPLTFVLAEFRFSQILKISEKIPSLQEVLRKKYPNLKTISEQVVEMQASGIKLGSMENWWFISSNKKSAIGINQERLMVVTAEYPRFEGFSGQCKEALQLLKDIAEPGLIFRIGLRCGDLIKPDGVMPNGEKEKLFDLVDSHCMPAKIFSAIGSNKQYNSENVTETDCGNMIIRTLYGVNNIRCLPDIQMQLQQLIDIKISDEPSQRVILDFDHIWSAEGESEEFDVDFILSKLASLHKTSRDAFWNITTDYAREEKWI
jgi:uncharacterized protein (TIGR04255 family)